MQTDSLCRFPQCPGRSVCGVCELISNPRALNSRALGSLARNVAAKLAKPTPPVPAAPSPTEAALRAEIERVKAENAKLATRRAVGLHPAPAPVADPEKTAPAPEARNLAPAPAPIPGPLVPGAWGELARRVDAGELSQAEGERIGAEWMANMRGVTARA